jgi:hypothetical protein
VAPPNVAKEGSDYAGVMAAAGLALFVSGADVVMWCPERLGLFASRLRVV